MEGQPHTSNIREHKTQCRVTVPTVLKGNVSEEVEPGWITEEEGRNPKEPSTSRAHKKGTGEGGFMTLGGWEGKV